MPTRNQTPSGQYALSSNVSTSKRRLRVVAPRDGADDPASALDDHHGDYNLQILQPLFGYVRSQHGEDTLSDIIHDCGLPPSALERKSGWMSHERFEHLLASTRELVESDEEFMRACVYEAKKQYGVFLLILRCMSVQASYELLAKTGHMVCSVGRFSTVPTALGKSTRILYETDRSESRLICLSRQAQLSSLPTLFLGMGPAKLKEHSCVAHGDDRCEYELSWYEPLRLRWVGAGLVAGALAAFGIPEALVHPGFAYSALPLLGGATGAVLEMRRLLVEQMRFGNETTLEMEKVIVSHAQATDELTSLRERERDWNRHVEEGVAARTRKLNAVIDRLRGVIRHRSGGFPIVQKNPGLAKDSGNAFQSPDRRALASSERLVSMENAVDRVSQLVGELVNIASDDTTKRNLEPEDVSVDALVAQIRRQLKATMIGRNVRITVFQTREAPATITTMRPILERVVDNVLLNASRHTDRGSVVVEASGTPGSLLIKLSDTGSGISKERLEQVFDDNNTEKNEPGGLGASNDRSGLAYAARLLDHLGGRLEIMSEPGVGTTLWLYIPVTPPPPSAAPVESRTHRDQPSSSNPDGIVGRVVRIRSALTPTAEADPER